jgi:hypothetical protein
LNTKFQKLAQPAAEIADCISRWENDPELIPFIRPNKRLELVDGCSVDWTQKYLSNAKERLMISGIGSERLCREFGTRTAAS